MSLKTYKSKRDLKKTSEPSGKKQSPNKHLIFVVQKHNARQLHYDFRLELNGILKSWAIPKGPSMNPSDKRLARMVDDHQYEYKDFEGVIPESNYGAGEVIVWDNGTYIPVEGSKDKNENEKIIDKALSDGYLKMILQGKKLKGEFGLVKMKYDEKSWLLIKKKDKFSSSEDVLRKNKSVLSGNTIEKMKKENGGRNT